MEENKSNNFLVCIQCFTYNQAPYITDALNGFTMQQTTFPFIAMVVDDASTDGEQEVIAKYVEEYFETDNSEVAYLKETDYAHITYAQHKINKNCHIVVLYLKENHHQQKKAKSPYLSQWRENTKYEAFCEGDDYWIDPLKLQKQVDFLENNPEYVMSYTNAIVINTSDVHNKINRRFKGISGIITNYLIVKGNPIVTASVCIRMNVCRQYEKEKIHYRLKMMMGDLPLWIYASKEGLVHYVDEKCVAYRVLSSSASHHSNPDSTKEFIENIKEIQLYMNKYYRFGYLENDIIVSHYKRLIINMSRHSKSVFIKTINECILKSPISLFDAKVIYCILKRLLKS